MPTLFEKFGELLKEIMELPGHWEEKAERIKAHSNELNLAEFLSWFDGIAEESEDDEDDDWDDDDDDYDFFDDEDDESDEPGGESLIS